MVELAAATPPGSPVKADEIAARQAIPSRFLASCSPNFAVPRWSDVVVATPAATGWRCRRVRSVLPTSPESSMARLADVHGVSPESFGPPGVAASRKELWIAVRAALRSVVAQGNIADLATGTPPAGVAALLDDPDAWMRRPDPAAVVAR